MLLILILCYILLVYLFVVYLKTLSATQNGTVRACESHKRENEFIQSFGGKARRKEIISMT
jgi:hypothetical protein